MQLCVCVCVCACARGCKLYAHNHASAPLLAFPHRVEDALDAASDIQAMREYGWALTSPLCVVYHSTAPAGGSLRLTERQWDDLASCIERQDAHISGALEGALGITAAVARSRPSAREPSRRCRRLYAGFVLSDICGGRLLREVATQYSMAPGDVQMLIDVAGPTQRSVVALAKSVGWWLEAALIGGVVHARTTGDDTGAGLVEMAAACGQTVVVMRACAAAGLSTAEAIASAPPGVLEAALLPLTCFSRDGAGGGVRSSSSMPTDAASATSIAATARGAALARVQAANTFRRREAVGESAAAAEAAAGSSATQLL
jgi:hypothetical protein